MKMHH